MESTHADVYEFLGELCYLKQDSDEPLIIENTNTETVPMDKLRCVFLMAVKL